MVEKFRNISISIIDQDDYDFHIITGENSLKKNVIQ